MHSTGYCIAVSHQTLSERTERRKIFGIIRVSYFHTSEDTQF